MRHILALTLVPLLVGVMPVADSPPATSAAQPEPAQSPAPRTSRIGRACGYVDGPPPTSADGWWKRADAIVRVRIDAHHAYYHYADRTLDPDILTDVEVTILEAFKPHSQGVTTGAATTITHFGGAMKRADGPETHTTNDFPPPPVGTEWFLFLNWDAKQHQFRISYFDEGAFQVIDGSLKRPGRSQRAPAWVGTDAGVLAEALRKGPTPPAF